MNKVLKLNSSFYPAGDQPEAILKLKTGLKNGKSHQVLLGVTGSGKTFTIANVIADLQRPAIIIAPNKILAAQLYHDMKNFFPDNAVEYFVSYYDYYQPEAYLPSSNTFIEKSTSINKYIEQMRLSATRSLLERKDVIIVSSVSAIYGLGDPNIYLKMIINFSIGMIIDQRDILHRLIELQYIRNDYIFQNGMFRVRGNIIDIFPAEFKDIALRIEIFNKKIESLFIFNPFTGHIKSKVQNYTIYPKTHYAITREKTLLAIKKIKKEFNRRRKLLLNNGKINEEKTLSQRIKFDLEMMNEMGYCSGIENYSRYLYNRKPNEMPITLFSYLPKNSLLIIDESHVTIPQIKGMYNSDRARKETLIEYGFRLPSALDNRPLKFKEFEKLAPQTIYISATPGNYELKKTKGNVVDQLIRPTGLLDPILEIKPIDNQINDLTLEIRKRKSLNERILVTTLTKKMAENLTEYLEEQGEKVRYIHSNVNTIERMEIIHDLRLGKFDILIGINLLREGLDIPEVSLVAILDADKEGIFRSERSLIQTIGRAARNINGKVILYCNKITSSMLKAIKETERRRKKQQLYNKEHNIIPKNPNKKIIDISILDDNSLNDNLKKDFKSFKFNSIKIDLNHNSIFIEKKISKLKKQMMKYAQELRFEEAAEIRNQISYLKNS